MTEPDKIARVLETCPNIEEYITKAHRNQLFLIETDFASQYDLYTIKVKEIVDTLGEYFGQAEKIEMADHCKKGIRETKAHERFVLLIDHRNNTYQTSTFDMSE